MVDTPALVRGETLHRRRRPFVHALKFRTYLWLINVDEIPKLPLARWRVKDHFKGGAASIRSAVEAFASANNEAVMPTDRILMLAAPSTFGHVFNPLTVYYCIDANQEIRWVILEIHNTYGGRHAHLLKPDAKGAAGVAKEFYVSPFFEIRGDYQVTIKLGQDRVLSVVNLHQDGELVFSASFSGQPVPVNLGNRILAMLRTPLVNLQTTLRIRLHGVYLWLRRLPVIKRPDQVWQKGMQ